MNTEMKFVLSSRKAGAEKEFKLGDLPEASFKAIFAYGCQRFINDKLGGSETGQNEAREKFAELVEILFSESGWQGRQTGGGSSADPIKAQMTKMAQTAIKAAIKAKGIKIGDVPKAKLAELVESYTQANEEALRLEAEKVVEAAKRAESALAGMELNLDDL